MELCLIIATVGLAVTVLSLLAFLWLRMPPTDTVMVEQHANALQMAFHQGCQWNQSIALDKATYERQIAEEARKQTHGEPVVNPDDKQFPDEEVVEMPRA